MTEELFLAGAVDSLPSRHALGAGRESGGSERLGMRVYGGSASSHAGYCSAEGMVKGGARGGRADDAPMSVAAHASPRGSDARSEVSKGRSSGGAGTPMP